jgi:LysM repeat protein
VDEEKTKGRTWNGYVCPGCRTVFRVAADFMGADVMCPSCKETLRLPKTPEEVPPHNSVPETPTTFEPSTFVQRDQERDTKPSMLHGMLATYDGRLKLSLALALVLGAVVFFALKKPTSIKTAQKSEPPIHQETKTQEKTVPPPPPIATSEIPIPASPTLPPQPEETPVPEVAVIQPVPESPALTAEPVAETIVETVPEPAPPINTSESGLVEAIPATERPPAPPAAKLEPDAAADPAELVHTVARGDTLNKISRKYQVSASTIRKSNGIKGDAVMLGQKLKIPGAITPSAEPAPATVVETPTPAPQAARSHTVARGDTLERIARKYGVTSQQVMQANGMKNDVVRLGRKLVIPAAQ